MKKVLFLIFLLLIVTSTVFAEKQEWFDKSYKFNQNNNIVLELYYLPQYNGISENETVEIFKDKTQNIYNNLKEQNYKFFSISSIAEQIKKQKNIDLAILYESKPEEADKIYYNYIKENMDLLIKTEIIAYDIGTQYFEGYFINLPTVDTSYVTTPYGSSTVTTYGNSPQYINGGNFPVVYCCVRFTAYSLPDGKMVWRRIDDRAKANRSIFENTTPKDVYKRIIGSWTSDLENKLERDI